MRSPAWPFPVGAWHKARLTVNQVKKENHMEALQKRLEALEQQTEQLKHHTQAVERRLRWWRRMAYGLGVLGLLGLPLTSVKAQEGYSATKELRSLARRVEDLEYKLVHITSGPADVNITGAKSSYREWAAGK